jgi:hypothetical protein
MNLKVNDVLEKFPKTFFVTSFSEPNSIIGVLLDDCEHDNQTITDIKGDMKYDPTWPDSGLHWEISFKVDGIDVKASFYNEKQGYDAADFFGVRG